MRLLVITALLSYVAMGTGAGYVSVIGDPGLANPVPAVAYTGWNFCNGALAPPVYNQSVSPRLADCVLPDGAGPDGNAITDSDNNLGPGQPFPNPAFPPTTDINLYAREKELYLASKCAVASPDGSFNASFWMVMFKSGNMNTAIGVCPHTNFTPAAKDYIDMTPPLTFNNLPMNQPYIVHAWTAPVPVPYSGTGPMGYIAGTYDVAGGVNGSIDAGLHEYTQAWWAYRIAEVAGQAPPNKPSLPPALLTNPTYPWLMNYLRSNDVTGGYGGYPWQGGGNMNGPVPSYKTNITLRLNVIEPGAVTNNFYLPEISGCWQMDGSPCTGNLSLDVTRYICFGVNPAVKGPCGSKNQGICPPFHWTINGTRIPRNDTANFPYECYNGHCAAGSCDPYSNPNTQEIMQLLPCAEWAAHGFPSKKGDAWVGDDRVWNMDVGALAARVYLSGAEPADVPDRAEKGWAPLPPLDTLPPYPGWTRSWVSFEVGPEQFDPASVIARWEVSHWDVKVASV